MKNTFIRRARSLVSLGDKFLKEHGLRNFHQESKRLLESARLHEFYDFDELVKSSFESTFNHHQSFSHFEFSDLPLTIARGENCFIDLYFWRRRPTVIHDHHFIGSFQCLKGLNVDLEFKFKMEKKITKYHSLGKLELARERILRPGQIVSINYLNKFIHQNHHQADLTINLCFRTPDLEGKHLHNYLYSGLKFEKNPVSLGRIDRLQAFALMGPLQIEEVDFSLIDAINFLLLTYGSSSVHPQVIKLMKFFDVKVKRETGVNIVKLLEHHEKELNKIESSHE